MVEGSDFGHDCSPLYQKAEAFVISRQGPLEERTQKLGK